MRVAIEIPRVEPGQLRLLRDWVTLAERLGVASAFAAEAWWSDAVTPLAYLAAHTERIQLGTGIMQVTARTPAMTAMTALTLNDLTDGRFILGLGASGPQVVEASRRALQSSLDAPSGNGGDLSHDFRRGEGGLRR